MDAKAMTLRLSREKAAELEATARADEMTVSDAAREAIEGYIKKRRSDKSFQARLKRLMEEEREVLDRLAR